MKKKIIYGCEARGDERSAYMTRYTIFECKHFQICLHIFYRSDHTEHHDHPWNFMSIILWRGYLEETVNSKHSIVIDNVQFPIGKDGIKAKRVWPGMILFRKATHRHRVVLVNEKKAITLVFMSKRKREWGFFTNTGWKKWTKYFIEQGC